MNTTNKIMLTFLVSLMVLGGGGYYLYNAFSSPTAGFAVQTTNVTIIPSSPVTAPGFSLSSKSGGTAARSASSNSRQSSPVTLHVNSNMELVNGFSPVGSAASYVGTSSGSGLAMQNRSRVNDLYSSNLSGAVAMDLSLSGGASKSTANDGGSASISGLNTPSITAPLSVPFSSGNTNVVLVDPGGDPKSMIPVGEGWWVLLLLAGVYTGLRAIIKK